MQLLLQNRLTHGQLLDAIEPDLEAGGQIIDWHACDSDRKLDENMDAEIMEVLLQEARDSYDEEIVVELQSDDLDQIDENIERIQAWIENWKKDHSEE
jgi:adenylate kinase